MEEPLSFKMISYNEAKDTLVVTVAEWMPLLCSVLCVQYSSDFYLLGLDLTPPCFLYEISTWQE